MSSFAEPKRRNVIRMAGLYLVGAWLIVQVVGTVSSMLGAPEWVGRTVLVLLAIGFVAAPMFATGPAGPVPQGRKRRLSLRIGLARPRVAGRQACE